MDCGLPRHEPNNPYNYSTLELALKQKALKAMKRDFPDVPDLWIELCYDTIGHMPSDEVDRIIANKEWENKESKYKALGGAYVGCEVLDAD